MTTKNSRPDNVHRSHFAQHMTEAVRRAGSDEPIRFNPKSFELIIGDAQPFRFFLDNAYDNYVAAPQAHRSKVLDHFASAILSPSEVPESYEDAASHLVAPIRRRCSLDHERMRADLKGREYNAPAHCVLCSHLIAEISIDLPDKFVGLDQSTLSQCHTPVGEVLSRARDNIARLTVGGFDSLQGGLYVSPWHDNYDAMRILLTDVIEQLSVKGHPVAAIPDRDSLIVTGSDDLHGLRMMAELIQARLCGSYTISGLPVMLRGGRWETFIPDAGSADTRLLRRIGLSAQTLECNQQKELLDAIHTRDGVDTFVAPHCLLLDPETNESYTTATWTRGTCSLIPRAEILIFVNSHGDEPESAMIRWEVAKATLGRLIRSVGGYPERFLVDSFPSQQQLEEMQSVAGCFQDRLT